MSGGRRWIACCALVATGLAAPAAAESASLVRYRVIGGDAAGPRPDLRIATDGSGVLRLSDQREFTLPARELRTLKARVAAARAARPKRLYRSRTPVGDAAADVLSFAGRRVTVQASASRVPRAVRRLIAFMERIVRRQAAESGSSELESEDDY